MLVGGDTEKNIYTDILLIPFVRISKLKHIHQIL